MPSKTWVGATLWHNIKSTDKTKISQPNSNTSQSKLLKLFDKRPTLDLITYSLSNVTLDMENDHKYHLVKNNYQTIFKALCSTHTLNLKDFDYNVRYKWLEMYTYFVNSHGKFISSQTTYTFFIILL